FRGEGRNLRMDWVVAMQRRDVAYCDVGLAFRPFARFHQGRISGGHMPARKCSQWLMMIAATVLLCASTAAPASEQSFPKGPVRFVLSTPAGGVTDVIARLVADGLSARWSQPVIVDNRPGGNAAVSALAVERSAPDGHTLLVTSDATFTANPFMIERLAYTPQNFTPIAVLCSITPMLVVSDALPIKSVKELIAYAKSKPGAL